MHIQYLNRLFLRFEESKQTKEGEEMKRAQNSISQSKAVHYLLPLAVPMASILWAFGCRNKRTSDLATLCLTVRYRWVRRDEQCRGNEKRYEERPCCKREGEGEKQRAWTVHSGQRKLPWILIEPLLRSQAYAAAIRLIKHFLAARGEGSDQ